MNETPPAAARSRMATDCASSHCTPNVMVPRHRRATFRPVRPRRATCMWLSYTSSYKDLIFELLAAPEPRQLVQKDVDAALVGGRCVRCRMRRDDDVGH